LPAVSATARLHLIAAATPIRRGSREARSINQLSHQREPHGRRIRPIPALVSAQPVKTFATS